MSLVKLYRINLDNPDDPGPNAGFLGIDENGIPTIILEGAVPVSFAPQPAQFQQVNWKGGTPGNPYVNGDTVNASLGDIIMVDVQTLQSVTINMPLADADSAGQAVTFLNMNDKFAQAHGDIVLSPEPGNRVGAEAALGADAEIAEAANVNSAVLRSDGNGGWWLEASAAGGALTAV